jgi:hypothetical protein
MRRDCCRPGHPVRHRRRVRQGSMLAAGQAATHPAAPVPASGSVPAAETRAAARVRASRSVAGVVVATPGSAQSRNAFRIVASARAASGLTATAHAPSGCCVSSTVVTASWSCSRWTEPSVCSNLSRATDSAVSAVALPDVPGLAAIRAIRDRRAVLFPARTEAMCRVARSGGGTSVGSSDGE